MLLFLRFLESEATLKIKPSDKLVVSEVDRDMPTSVPFAGND